MSPLRFLVLPLLLVIVGITTLTYEYVDNTKKAQSNIISSPSPKPSPTAYYITVPVNTPSAQASPTTKKVTAATKPISETDPVVSCEMTKECGGEIEQMRQSTCRSTVCCKVDASKYQTVASDAECTNVVNAYWGSKTYSVPSYHPPTYTFTPIFCTNSNSNFCTSAYR